MPQPKKHASVRARANKASTAATLVRAGEQVPSVPVMPSGPDWHSETVAWWAAVWASPMSPEWDESDVHNVVICALLYNDIWRAETAKERKDAAGEFRLQRRDLGLTPYDRRRLEWTIETVDAAKAQGDARRQRQASAQPSPGEDPRLALVN